MAAARVRAPLREQLVLDTKDSYNRLRVPLLLGFGTYTLLTLLNTHTVCGTLLTPAHHRLHLPT